MKRKFYLSIIVLLLVFTLYLSGCSSSEPQFPSSGEVKSLLDETSQVKSLEVKSINLLIDGSESMRGFVSDRSSVYRNVLQKLYLNLRAEAPIKVYKFGERVVEFASRDFQRSIQDIYFYNEPSTYLDNVISNFINPTLTSTLTIIVTDGIQSRRREGYNLSGMIDCLASKINSGWYIELLGFRSNFDGKVYSELNQGLSFRYKGSRPFYMFIFSPNLEKINLIKDILKVENIPFNSLGINSSFGDYNIEFLEEQSSFSLYEKKDNVIFLEYSKGKLRELEKEDFLKFSYVLNFSFRENTMFKPPLEFDVVIKGKKLGDKRSLEENYLPVQKEYKSQGRTSYLFNYVVKKPKDPGYYNYKIEYFPRFTSLTAPSWIVNWSTDDDTKFENCSKTLYLSELFNLLARRIICKQKLAEVYISFYFGGGR